MDCIDQLNYGFFVKGWNPGVRVNVGLLLLTVTAVSTTWAVVIFIGQSELYQVTSSH